MVLRRADVVIPDYLWPSRPEVGRLAWAPLPAILHFDPPVRQLLNTEIKTKNENYHSKQLLSPFDRARHSGGIRRNYRDSFIGGRLCDSYKRHKQDHGERSMGTDHGFEADMPYPPLSPEQPLETGEDRDPSMQPSSNSRLSRPGAFMLITFSASVKNCQGRGRGDQQGLLNLK
mgnify:CR=1 FL=1